MIAAHFSPASSALTMKRTLGSRRWAPSIAAVAAFGALGATCAYWALQLFAPPIAIAPAGSIVDTRSAPELVGAQALFGSTASETTIAAPADLEIRVLGVAASPSRGSAVLVVDTDTARAFLVGDEVDDGLRLVDVRSDAAVLERNGVRLELPAPQRPSVTLLSSGPDAADTTATRVAPNEAPASSRDAAIAASTPDGTPGADGTREFADAPDIPDGRTLGAMPSPRGGGPVVDPSRFSGIRGGSVRAVGSPTSGQAPAPGAVR